MHPDVPLYHLFFPKGYDKRLPYHSSVTITFCDLHY